MPYPSKDIWLSLLSCALLFHDSRACHPHLCILKDKYHLCVHSVSHHIYILGAKIKMGDQILTLRITVINFPNAADQIVWETLQTGLILTKRLCLITYSMPEPTQVSSLVHSYGIASYMPGTQKSSILCLSSVLFLYMIIHLTHFRWTSTRVTRFCSCKVPRGNGCFQTSGTKYWLCLFSWLCSVCIIELCWVLPCPHCICLADNR